MKSIPYLVADEVTESNRNEIIHSIIFTVKQNTEDRFDKDSWIKLQEFALEVVSVEFQLQHYTDAKQVFHVLTYKFYEEHKDMPYEQMKAEFERQQSDDDWYKTLPLDQQVFQGFEILKSVGCTHDICGCKVQCNICKDFYGCRRCHDEVVDSHEFPKEQTQLVQCRYCDEVQDFSMQCTKCQKMFGKVTCKTCKFISDISMDAKPFFHCDKCTSCNVGLSQYSIHCDTCEVCMSTEYYKTHVCKEFGSCMVCLGELKRSKYPSEELKCGHMLHRACYDQLMEKMIFKCPACKKFLPVSEDVELVVQYQNDIFENTLISPSQLDQIVSVICNDCGQQFPAVQHPFQQYYCIKCKCYNCEQISSQKFNFNDYQKYIITNDKEMKFPPVCSVETIKKVLVNKYKEIPIKYLGLFNINFIKDEYLDPIAIMINEELPETLQEFLQQLVHLIMYAK
ncbi:RING_finger and CHY zinc finger domain-containing protein [Hexamita inflata]|uniref:RING finger and CHY zinc finger domain-containing protein n=1 Tax=Hexamita inflata TaxID=28002 RepID=A0AA86TGY7_9EUKA|nr:RING finger and CHY zinc finger domain-containing protein [Hexamita inflata]